MDARAILDTVAKTYAKLKTLAVEVRITTESGDEGQMQRGEQRTRAYFAAPDRVRIEPAGPRGITTVTDGHQMHVYFGMAVPNRYSKASSPPRDRLPGMLQPEFPVGSGAVFLFQRIAEQVLATELVREEGSSLVLSVTYEPRPNSVMSCSPVLLWIDSRTHLVSRLEGTVSHRMPAHNEVHVNRFSLALTSAVVDGPIPEETFSFAPPEDAVEAGSGCVVGGGGGGSRSRGPAGNLETWTSHEWAGETVIERSKLRLHGIHLTIERRLTRSDDGRELRVIESITGPQGKTVREFAILLTPDNQT